MKKLLLMLLLFYGGMSQLAWCQTDSTTQTQSDQQNKSSFEGKDPWDWFWNHKAYIHKEQHSGFWDPDGVPSNFVDNYVVPAWNAIMEPDFVRIGVLLVLAGIPIGWGIKLSGAMNGKSKERS